MAEERLCLGVVVGVRGLKGEVRIKSFTAAPGDVAAYGPVETRDGRKLSLNVTGEAKGVVVARVDGVADRAAAEALKGESLYVDRRALPQPEDEDEFYHADLIGLNVVDEAETEIGTVIAVYDFGGGDVIDIRRPDGRAAMAPFTRAAVPRVDLVTGRLCVVRSSLVDDAAPEDGSGDSESPVDADTGEGE